MKGMLDNYVESHEHEFDWWRKRWAEIARERGLSEVEAYGMIVTEDELYGLPEGTLAAERAAHRARWEPAITAMAEASAKHVRDVFWEAFLGFDGAAGP